MFEDARQANRDDPSPRPFHGDGRLDGLSRADTIPVDQ
ncbi:hypothetical protein GLA29479_589 [Lysobacter antibioticus]|nr:hypothetical protein GLA29479_589 [Lysobacter antibioticus]